jgi:pimeloyl-ACP methyl ester carboxylesterase
MQRRDLLISALTATATASSAPAATKAAPSDRGKAPTTVYSRDGVRLFHRDWGSGQPVLFVHSWALDHTIWNYQTLFLSQHGLRCIAFDWRGHGRSDTPRTGYDLDSFADDIAAVIHDLDLRDVVLVGHSTGGGHIVRYLRRHGSTRIAKTVLVAPTIPFMLRTDDNPQGAPQSYFEELQKAWANDFPKWIEDNKAPFFTPNTSLATMNWIADLMRGAYLPAITLSHELYFPVDLRSETRAVDRPTLILQGDKDVSAPPEMTGHRAAALIRNSTLKVYPGAGHGVFLTHHHQLNQDMLDFIRA